MQMRNDAHNPFVEKGLSLSDHLAIDRTILANERTALAYGRTVLAMLVIGGTCIKFFETWFMWSIGAVFIAGAVVVAVIGWRRFRRTQRYLAAALSHQTGESQHPLREQVEETAGKDETARRSSSD